MTAGFVAIPGTAPYWLRNATVPATLLTELPSGAPVSADGLAIVDLAIRDGQIREIVAAGEALAGGRTSRPPGGVGGLGGRPEPPMSIESPARIRESA